MTLRELTKQHPDWLDYDIVIYTLNGSYEYIGASGFVYLADVQEELEESIMAKAHGSKVVVFSGN